MTLARGKMLCQGAVDVPEIPEAVLLSFPDRLLKPGNDKDAQNDLGAGTRDGLGRGGGSANTNEASATDARPHDVPELFLGR